MLTVKRALKIISVNQPNPPGATPLVIETGCNGMDRCIGVMVYTTVAPAAGVPTVEFSYDGVNWDSIQAAPADITVLVDIGYRWDFQIFNWRFVRVTINPPGIGETVRGHVSLLPSGQN